MKDVIMTVVCVGIVSGIISLFFDDNEMSKYIKLVLSLCFLCAIIPGGINLLKNAHVQEELNLSFGIEDMSTISDTYYSQLVNESSKQLSDELYDLVVENTGIKPMSVDIQLSVDKNDYEIVFHAESVRITVLDNTEQEKIAEYVKLLLGIQPEFVVYENEVQNEKN